MKRYALGIVLALTALLLPVLAASPASAAGHGYVKCTVTPTTTWGDADYWIDNDRNLDSGVVGWGLTKPDQIWVTITGPNGSLGNQYELILNKPQMSGSGQAYNFPNTNHIPVGSDLRIRVNVSGSNCYDHDTI